MVKPVTLPPGREHVVTRPALTGFALDAKTIGILLVARFAASVPGRAGSHDHIRLKIHEFGC